MIFSCCNLYDSQVGLSYGLCKSGECYTQGKKCNIKFVQAGHVIKIFLKFISRENT
jgi:hypothetical protein